MELKIDLEYTSPARLRQAIAFLQAALPDIEAEHDRRNAELQKYVIAGEQFREAEVALETPPLPTLPVVEPTAPALPEADNPATGVPAVEDVRALANALIAGGKRREVNAAILSFGVKAVSDIPADKRADVIALLETL